MPIAIWIISIKFGLVIGKLIKMLEQELTNRIKTRKLICLTIQLGQLDTDTVIIGRINSFDNDDIYLYEVNPYGVFY